MKFINSYKKLEKLCGEIFGSASHGISEYIEEMEHTTNGKFYVNGWGEDYKKLKHYRYLRNKIVHEPSCNEESMCTSRDAQWLDDFYFRIINRQDPLSMYRKATTATKASKSIKRRKKSAEFFRQKPKKKKSYSFLHTIAFIAGLLIFILIINFIIKGFIANFTV